MEVPRGSVVTRSVALLAVVAGVAVACGEDPAPRSVLVGDGPFGRHLAGSALFEQVGSRDPERRMVTIEADIYFPAGRVPGGEVVLAMRSDFPREGLLITRSVVGDDGNATGLDVPMAGGRTYYRSTALGFEGALTGDAVMLDVDVNLAPAQSDIGELYRGALRLEVVGDVPEARLAPWPRQNVVAPNAALWVSTTVPLSSVAELRATTATGDVAIVATEEDGRIVVRAREAFPPNAQVMLDASASTDILGRPVGTEPVPPPLATTTVAAPGAFADAPAGAIAGSNAPRFGTASGGGTPLHPYWGLVALEAADADELRISARLDCLSDDGNAPQSFAAHLVAAGGAMTEIPFVCTAEPATVELTRPAPGPLWIAVTFDTPGPAPQWGQQNASVQLTLLDYTLVAP